MNLERTAIMLVIVSAPVLLCVAQAREQFPGVGPVRCRHDAAALPQDRARRAQALALGRAITVAEATAVRASRSYQPVRALPGLPIIPAGFRLVLRADEDGYLFSIRDESDPCHFTIFSDERGQLYEVSAQAPQVAG